MMYQLDLTTLERTLAAFSRCKVQIVENIIENNFICSKLYTPKGGWNKSEKLPFCDRS